jgi:transcriptional regulator with XRE-family HTH domain
MSNIKLNFDGAVMGGDKVSNLSSFLREQRLKANLSQRAVAAKLGYSTSQFVSNWERELADPPVEVLPTLAELYGIPKEQMLKIFLDAKLEEVTANLRKKFFGRKR